jgi:hypothetical protein
MTMTTIWDDGSYLACQFLLQLPYLNDAGKPLCIGVSPHDADKLVRNGTHRTLHADGYLYVITPRVSAATDVAFQIGQDPL